jgi:hypothetical protein
LRALVPVGILLIWLWTASAAGAGEVLRGIDEPRLFWPHARAGVSVLDEIGGDLNAGVIRADINWPSAEPQRGQYDQAYLDRVAAGIAAAHARGLKVVVLVYRTPRWASDHSLWDRPIPGDQGGVYQDYYPPAPDRLPDFRAFAERIARTFQGTVLAYEPWCEPNMSKYIYPQRTARYDDFAARRYARMLRAFASGVRAADPAALVSAGATAPFGRNDRYGTSPQRFARQLRALGTAGVFDVYTHHPYVPGGTRDTAPEAQPRDPSTTVSLGNIGTLLRIFPGKPFYLTEFGWSTHASYTFGVQVSCVQQASYLRRAFAWMARFPQVKLGIWYPLKDMSGTDGYGDEWGVYTGLRMLDGTPKRAYYAFAGGNSISVDCPSAIDKGADMILRGALVSATMGPLADKALVLEGRKAGGRWVIVARCRTGLDGRYVFNVRPAVGALWRVRWRGVTGSGTRWVAVRD